MSGHVSVKLTIKSPRYSYQLNCPFKDNFKSQTLILIVLRQLLLAKQIDNFLQCFLIMDSVVIVAVRPLDAIVSVACLDPVGVRVFHIGFHHISDATKLPNYQFIKVL